MAKATISHSIKENSGSLGKSVITSTDTKATDANVVALANAIKGISLGSLVGSSIAIDSTAALETAIPPVGAQRGQKVLVKGTAANTNAVHICEFPCFDSSLIGSVGSDNVPIGAGAMATLKSALETVWTDLSGNAITVTSAQYVNRSI